MPEVSQPKLRPPWENITQCCESCAKAHYGRVIPRGRKPRLFADKCDCCNIVRGLRSAEEFQMAAVA